MGRRHNSKVDVPTQRHGRKGKQMTSHRLRWAPVSVAAVIVAFCAARAGATRKVTVGPKTTLDGLARKYDVPKATIARANGIEPEAILRDGQALVIPDSPPLVKTPACMSLTASIKGDRVALRRGPGLSYLRVTLLDHGAPVEITARQGEWYQIRCATTPNAWIRSDFVSINGKPVVQADRGTKSVAAKAARKPAARAAGKQLIASGHASAPTPRVIKGDRVSVRSAASRDSKRLTLLDDGAQVTLLAKHGDWCKIRLASGRVGWVMASYIAARSRTGAVPAASETLRRQASRSSQRATASTTRTGKQRSAYAAKSQSSKSRRVATTSQSARKARTSARASSGKHDVVRTAYAYRGTRYRYGGSARGGFDCSGFTSYVYRMRGVDLPHNAAAQFQCGTAVGRSHMKEGDLVFFETTRRGISHVGIYVGNGKFVHASSARGQVRVDSLDGGYYASRFRGARRVK